MPPRSSALEKGWEEQYSQLSKAEKELQQASPKHEVFGKSYAKSSKLQMVRNNYFRVCSEATGSLC